VETAGGLLNCIGLQNVGIDEFINKKMPFLSKLETTIMVNINGSTVEEYVVLAQKLSEVEGVHALEVNVSCPNVDQGGIIFGSDPGMTEKVTSEIRAQTHLPVIVKLSPNVTDLPIMAKAAWNGGADILSLINSLLGMAIDPYTQKPVLSNITGGLSGPAIKPVALRCVWQTARAVPLPIIGMGGICSGEDAIEFLLAGASAVSIGTANFLYPDAGERVLDGIVEYCRKYNILDVMTLVGALKDNN